MRSTISMTVDNSWEEYHGMEILISHDLTSSSGRNTVDTVHPNRLISWVEICGLRHMETEATWEIDITLACP